MLQDRHKREKALQNRRRQASKFMLAMLSQEEPNYFTVLYLRLHRNCLADTQEEHDLGHLLYGLWQQAGVKHVTIAEGGWWMKEGYIETAGSFSHKTKERLERWAHSLDIRDGLCLLERKAKVEEFTLKESHKIPSHGTGILV